MKHKHEYRFTFMRGRRCIKCEKLWATTLFDNQKVQKSTHGIAIACLLLNMFLFPGVGSLVARRNEGVVQLVLALISLPLMFILIGFPLYLAAWVWGVVSGIKALQESK